MRYFTRQRYEVAQEVTRGPRDEGFEHRIAEVNRESAEASLRYLEYLRQYESRLTDAVRSLSRLSLHDSRITHVERVADTVAITLDTSGAPAINDKTLLLIFRSVREAHGLENLVGQYILNEELYVVDDSSFEFSALCDRSEFGFRFLDVTIETPTA